MQKNSPDSFIRTYKKSEVIFEENSQGEEMFVVSSGKVRLFTKELGQECDLAILNPGEFFGEMSLIDAAPRSATATATEDNTCLAVLNQTKFLYLVSQQPGFALTIMHTLCQRMRKQSEQPSK